jgi:uncharacterized protein YbaR (Trm112 family)
MHLSTSRSTQERQSGSLRAACNTTLVEQELEIIDCPHCDARVQACEVACYERLGSEDDWSWPPYRVRVFACPVCKHALIYLEAHTIMDPVSNVSVDDDGAVWWPRRVYPPEPVIDERGWTDAVPELVRHSLHEAHQCFSTERYEPCAVMVGRALEALCRHFGTKNNSLGAGLRELREREVLPERLYEWARMIQQERNAAAHASGKEVSKVLAQDLLHFAKEICHWVFVLPERWAEFKARELQSDSDSGTAIH